MATSRKATPIPPAGLAVLAETLMGQLPEGIKATDEILIVSGASVLVPAVRLVTPLKEQPINFYEGAQPIAAELLAADPHLQHCGTNIADDEERGPADVILGVMLSEQAAFPEFYDLVHGLLQPGGRLGLIVHPGNLPEELREVLQKQGAEIGEPAQEGDTHYVLLTFRAMTEEERTAAETTETQRYVNDTLTIVHHFSAEEIYDLSKDLASKTQKLAALRLEKASSASSYAAQIKEMEKDISELSTKVANGDETRDVDVRITYNKPEPGFKTITRLDNGKEEVKRMDYEEKQVYAPTLFDEANLAR